MKQHIDHINKLFAFSRETFEDFSYAMDAEESKFKARRKSCYDQGFLLVKVFSSLRNSKIWFEEMELNTSNIEYNLYTNEVFTRQFKFISNFKKAISVYFYDNDLTTELHKKLQGINRKTFQKREDVLLAMQLFYIQVFDMFETKVDEYLINYIKLLNIPTADDSKDISHHFIALNYGVKNEEVINQIYKSLQGSHIKMLLPEFRKHFQEVDKYEPIQFIGSQANLINLFFGVSNLHLQGISVKNLDKLNMIIDHFEINGRKLTITGLRAQEAKMTTHPRKFNIIKDLLEKLMVIANNQ